MSKQFARAIHSKRQDQRVLVTFLYCMNRGKKILFFSWISKVTCIFIYVNEFFFIFILFFFFFFGFFLLFIVAVLFAYLNEWLSVTDRLYECLHNSHANHNRRRVRSICRTDRQTDNKLKCGGKFVYLAWQAVGHLSIHSFTHSLVHIQIFCWCFKSKVIEMVLLFKSVSLKSIKWLWLKWKSNERRFYGLTITVSTIKYVSVIKWMYRRGDTHFNVINRVN